MSQPSETAAASFSGSSRLAILLAMAMFVLVVDTSMMNVSISAIVAIWAPPSAEFNPPLPSKRWYPLSLFFRRLSAG
jgi:ADP-heptose:LPS heptosyltransferase